MINKRLLIKNLLGHSDENSFYDRKRKLSLNDREGKAKFIKHVCALANSNPNNNAYIIVGADDDKQILGVDFYDDSKIQHLINAYLENPPLVSYENICFPELNPNKVIGLVTIQSRGNLCSFRKNIWKYFQGSVFYREGSNSIINDLDFKLKDTNSETLKKIENQSSNNIEYTLEGVLNFINIRHRDMPSHYKVYKEQFVVCWAGIPKKKKEKTYYSRVDIELINERVQLFYSALDEVEIDFTEDTFTITEYVQLGIDSYKYYPLEISKISFHNNGSYLIEQDIIFNPPIFDKNILENIWNENERVLQKLQSEHILSENEIKIIEKLPSTYLICYLNGYNSAKEILENSRELLKNYDRKIYQSLKESLRILRKSINK